MSLRYLFTAKEAKELDEHAIHIAGFPGLVLMEKAAMTLASVLMEREDRKSGILFVCGTGNNGGDGLAAARLLHQQGFRTAVILIGNADKMTPDAKTQLKLAAVCDVPVVEEETLFLPHYDVVVDGLFGVGLDRDITGVYQKVTDDINASGKKVYAIDIPSGIHGASGAVMNTAVKADVTVTFGVNKRGLVLYPGCGYAGEVIVGDIGYPQASYEYVKNPAYYYEPEDLARIVPVRRRDGHKGSFGCVCVIAGSLKMSGAALFSAKAAYASGAGMVRLYSAEANRDVLLSGVPEAVFRSYEREDGNVDYAALDEAMEKGDCLVLGPGLGLDERAERIVGYVLEKCEKTVVLDGDGITLCQKEQLAGKSVAGKSARILTPHPKEFSGITGKDITQLKHNFLEEVRAFSAETGCIVVGKDARTTVSDGRELYVNVSGNSGMGTGGSGDVLTGIIAAFVAQGADDFCAAKAGVYIHGQAGDSFTEKYNEYSLTASGLVESLRYVFAGTRDGGRNG